MRYAPDRDAAEDILQEGFIKVFTRFDSFRGDGSLEGWIRRIIVNTAISWVKQRQKTPFALDVDSLQDKLADTEEEEALQLIERVSPETLMELIQTMPEGYRMVLNLFVFEGVSHKDIAELLQIAENTSKSQLSKARRWLRHNVLETEKKPIPELR
jgi:RNA polymerase sigma-70 factor (ECF subfamily)